MIFTSQTAGGLTMFLIGVVARAIVMEVAVAFVMEVAVRRGRRTMVFSPIRMADFIRVIGGPLRLFDVDVLA